jgi:hypothetical protein
VVGSKVAPGSLDLTDFSRTVLPVTVPSGAPFNSGTCQQVGVGALDVQAGDLPLVLQPVPDSQPLVQVAGASSPGPGQLNFLLCNFSGTNLAGGASVTTRVALLR